jgi:hypothetical protein
MNIGKICSALFFIDKILKFALSVLLGGVYEGSLDEVRGNKM